MHAGELGARNFRDVASISTPQTNVRASADKAGNEHGTRHENEARAGILGKPSYSIRSEKLESELNGDDDDMTTYNSDSDLVKAGKGCPLIFSTDDRTAKKHGLTLSEVCLHPNMPCRDQLQLPKFRSPIISTVAQ